MDQGPILDLLILFSWFYTACNFVRRRLKKLRNIISKIQFLELTSIKCHLFRNSKVYRLERKACLKILKIADYQIKNIFNWQIAVKFKNLSQAFISVRFQQRCVGLQH